MACCGRLVCVWSCCGSATQTHFFLNISVVLDAKHPSYSLHWSSHQKLCPLSDIQASVLCVPVCFCANTVKPQVCWQKCENMQMILHGTLVGRFLLSVLPVGVVNQMTEGDILNGSPPRRGFRNGVTHKPRQRK